MPSPRALALAMLLLARIAPAQAVIGPTEDATVAPAGAARWRLENSWEHYDYQVNGATGYVLNYTQLRLTTFGLEVGILRGLSAVLVVPESGNNFTNTWYGQHTDTLRIDSVVRYSHNGVGDLEFGAKFAWLPGPGEQDRIALSPGLHVRSALSGSYRLATGVPPDPTDAFGVATGSGRTALSAASQTDVMFGHGFWLTAVGRYLWPGAVTRLVQVRPPGDPLSQEYGTLEATQSGGNTWWLQATPRYVFGRYFSVGAQYTYEHRAASSFVGTKDTVIGTDTVHVDASTLDSLTTGTAQYLSGSVTYSTVAAYLQGKAGFPIEISYQYTATLAVTGSFPKQASTNSVVFRVWTRLWGADFKQAKP